MKLIKKFVFLSLATATLASPISAFADSSLIFSEEGIGMNVYNPIIQNKVVFTTNQNTRSIINGDKVDVSGGKLWTTWRDGRDFRANYSHSSKEHRASAKNSTSEAPKRSSWVVKGKTAISPWVSQTAFGNRVFGATR